MIISEVSSASALIHGRANPIEKAKIWIYWCEFDLTKLVFSTNRVNRPTPGGKSWKNGNLFFFHYNNISSLFILQIQETIGNIPWEQIDNNNQFESHWLSKIAMHILINNVTEQALFFQMTVSQVLLERWSRIRTEMNETWYSNSQLVCWSL